MTEMRLTLYGDPRTKKNSARILKSCSGGRFVAPSKAYVDYETDCLRQIKRPHSPISARVNVRCVYYMKTARRVDLANLIEATTDILVKAMVNIMLINVFKEKASAMARIYSRKAKVKHRIVFSMLKFTVFFFGISRKGFKKAGKALKTALFMSFRAKP